MQSDVINCYLLGIEADDTHVRPGFGSLWGAASSSVAVLLIKTRPLSTASWAISGVVSEALPASGSDTEILSDAFVDFPNREIAHWTTCISPHEPHEPPRYLIYADFAAHSCQPTAASWRSCRAAVPEIKRSIGFVVRPRIISAALDLHDRTVTGHTLGSPCI
ncbi:hypothetical protein LX32DRAFT_416487 [Colletotrichum zoysiae]|uniref:Uncharacterized protein n=1 Tax=Colletotrichum zoysiae TaxID=1216348 RepID=A0AAD9HH96_9PEZI|nr:hypothetical protein LX32DRAFT_416487 [Colletotrichum zoysiae]